MGAERPRPANKMSSGIIIIDKPAGWTSMDVCAKLRGILHERRVGHGGTLDPMATGVLPVFAGSATKAVEFAEKGDKEYIAGLRLGVVTNTQDTTGEVLEERAVSVGREALDAVLPQFTGPIEQIPPMYSAIKIKGKKLYELARRGQEVDRPPRPVTIHALEVLEEIGENEYLLRVRCSKGTYVRTLCHDIGQSLGCGGCMSSLRRTMAAGFTLKDTVTLEQVQEQGDSLLMPVDCLFAGCPVFLLTSPRAERLVRSGSPIPAPRLEPGQYRIYGQERDFLCLSQWENGQLQSIKNFFGG